MPSFASCCIYSMKNFYRLRGVFLCVIFFVTNITRGFPHLMCCRCICASKAIGGGDSFLALDAENSHLFLSTDASCVKFLFITFFLYLSRRFVVLMLPHCMHAGNVIGSGGDSLSALDAEISASFSFIDTSDGHFLKILFYLKVYFIFGVTAKARHLAAATTAWRRLTPKFLFLKLLFIDTSGSQICILKQYFLLSFTYKVHHLTLFLRMFAGNAIGGGNNASLAALDAEISVLFPFIDTPGSQSVFIF